MNCRSPKGSLSAWRATLSCATLSCATLSCATLSCATLWCLPLALLALVLLAGCGREVPVQVYEATATPRPATLEAPGHWRRVPPKIESVLYAFQVGAGQSAARVNISASGGGLLANVNRWRGLVNLPPLTQAELDAQLQPRTIDRFTVYDVEAIGPEDGTPRKAILGAIVPAAGDDWFIALNGPWSVVEKEKPQFQKFVAASVRALAASIRDLTPEEQAHVN